MCAITIALLTYALWDTERATAPAPAPRLEREANPPDPTEEDVAVPDRTNPVPSRDARPAREPERLESRGSRIDVTVHKFGRPAAKTQVTLLELLAADIVRKRLPRYRTATTDILGRVSFEDVPCAHYRLSAFLGGPSMQHAIEFRTSPTDRHLAKKLDLWPGALRVRVLGTKREYSGARVEIVRLHARGSTSARLDDRGEARFHNLVPGRYDFKLRKRGVIPIEAPRAIVQASKTTEVLLRILTRATVKVQIRDASPRVVVVRARPESPGNTGSRTRLAHGRGELLLAPGTWRLDARDPRNSMHFGPAILLHTKAGSQHAVQLRLR